MVLRARWAWAYTHTPSHQVWKEPQIFYSLHFILMWGLMPRPRFISLSLSINLTYSLLQRWAEDGCRAAGSDGGGMKKIVTAGCKQIAAYFLWEDLCRTCVEKENVHLWVFIYVSYENTIFLAEIESCLVMLLPWILSSVFYVMLWDNVRSKRKIKGGIIIFSFLQRHFHCDKSERISRRRPGRNISAEVNALKDKNEWK